MNAAADYSPHPPPKSLWLISCIWPFLHATKINLTRRMIGEGIREQKRAAEGYEEIGEVLNHGRHEGWGGLGGVRPPWRTLKATYVSDEADMCMNAEEGIERGWNGGVGANHVVLFPQKSKAPTAGWERTASGDWGGGAKWIVTARCSTPEGRACKHVASRWGIDASLDFSCYFFSL